MIALSSYLKESKDKGLVSAQPSTGELPFEGRPGSSEPPAEPEPVGVLAAPLGLLAPLELPGAHVLHSLWGHM